MSLPLLLLYLPLSLYSSIHWFISARGCPQMVSHLNTLFTVSKVHSRDSHSVTHTRFALVLMVVLLEQQEIPNGFPLWTTRTHSLYHRWWSCKLRDKIVRTSLVNRNASSIGSRDNRDVSKGSENHDFIGIALFGKQRYAPGELSIINICKRRGVIRLRDCLAVNLLGYSPYLNRYKWRTSPSCMNQSLVCSVACSTVVSRYSGRCPIYRPPLLRRSPCWPWIRQCHTTERPAKMAEIQLIENVLCNHISPITTSRKRSTCGRL